MREALRLRGSRLRLRGRRGVASLEGEEGESTTSD
jgi:hypothetical protein